MFFGRLQILTDRQEVHIRHTQIVHQLQNFITLFTKPYHDAGFGEHGRIDFLDFLQQPDRVEIACAWTNFQIIRWHSLQIVVEDIRLRSNNNF